MLSDFCGQRIKEMVNCNKIALQYEYNCMSRKNIYEWVEILKRKEDGCFENKLPGQAEI
jgi:hypothetical protein